jgi:AGZA family xanthine/uracil permease-like MFS transporter
LLGTSNTTTFVESSAGISEGGRTGLTSVVVSLLFLISLFFAPIVGLVPTQATAPALIIVGVLMMSPIMSINFDDFSEAFPAFMTIVMMPFSYSIANGLAAGFIFYPLVKLVMGKGKEISPIMYVL